MPTPVCSLGSDKEIVLESEICINMIPTLPKIRNSAIRSGDTPAKVDNRAKHSSSRVEAA